MVSSKNQVNIMMKNIADMTIGGTSFWLFGYALVYGRSLYTNWFCGFGDFLVDQPVNDVLMGQVMIGLFQSLNYRTRDMNLYCRIFLSDEFRNDFHIHCK